jgi:UDP-galactose transporter B1
MATCQSVLSSISALIYILLRGKSTETISQSLGLEPSQAPSTSTLKSNGSVTTNGNEKIYTNGAVNHPTKTFRHARGKVLWSYLQCSVFITCAAPFGFAALSYISYPAMVLGKSCKLVPVMIMNILLYRRRFAPHKYLVVFIVTAGITIFMGFGNDKAKSSKAHNSDSQAQTPNANLIGITYLLINLMLDGAINSTQDEIFARYKVTGQQMMFWINIFCTLITLMMTVLPLPHIPVIHPSTGGQAEFMDALAFIRDHPSIIQPLALFALTGALGQLFIFETLQHFGSLTLV